MKAMKKDSSLALSRICSRMRCDRDLGCYFWSREMGGSALLASAFGGSFLRKRST
jgi:hypothetical protein